MSQIVEDVATTPSSPAAGGEVFMFVIFLIGHQNSNLYVGTKFNEVVYRKKPGFETTEIQ